MYFFVRSNNPRPTFHMDMTPEERATMLKHVEYWTEKAERCGFVRETHFRENKQRADVAFSGTAYYARLKSEYKATLR